LKAKIIFSLLQNTHLLETYFIT